MCYSAQVEAGYKKYVRQWGADISLQDFFRLYWEAASNSRIKTPKAMDAAFANSQTDLHGEIKKLIDQRSADQITKLEQDIFRQKKRLADAERTLLTKTTKKATEDKRISAEKIEWSLGKLADIRRVELNAEDSRIFPGWFAPVMIMENGKRVIKPMRYQCRPADKPAFNDVKFPGTYNARRDNLQGFWKNLFGYSHGVMIASAFFENVALHNMQQRDLVRGEKEQNVIIEFRPRPAQEMLVACLWSHWKGNEREPELLSFAAITDEPPAEIAAAGHDRCIIPIKAENIDAWLDPDPKNLAALYALLDDRWRPHYEHRMAA